jgi:spore maturation protein CgeB
LKIVILGLSITSSWGNGHATTYRGLVREMAARGHDILFLERDVRWYAGIHRDMPEPPFGKTALYPHLTELQERYTEAIRDADCVIVGSYVPDGVTVGEWVQKTAGGTTAFYDIDTPVTLAALAADRCEYLSPALIPGYDLYLSFSGGTALTFLETHYGSPCARPLYCSVDPELYAPEPQFLQWDLGYMGTYSADRQPPLEKLLLKAARDWPEGRFCMAGPKYPEDIVWPANVQRLEHLPPSEHKSWYNSQRYTLNITRADMIRWGWSPSVRLFEAAACGVPILTDYWEGLEDFFLLGKEILAVGGFQETLQALRGLPEQERREIGLRARSRVLAEHTAAHRAEQLEHYLIEQRGSSIS